MKLLRNFIVTIAVNGAVLWFIAYKVPELWFSVDFIYHPENVYIIFGILGLVFWLINSVLKKILTILTLPIKRITLWIFSFVLNIAILYIFEQTINFLDLWITVHLGDIIQTLILSVIISIIYFVIKKIL